MIHPEVSTSEQIKAMYLQRVAPLPSQTDDSNDEALRQPEASPYSHLIVPSIRSNRASSSILPETEDQPFQDSHRATLRSSIATSEFMWLYDTPLMNLADTVIPQEPQQTIRRTLSRRSTKRQPSFLSRNISLRQTTTQSDSAMNGHHGITFKVSKPDSTYMTEVNVPISEICRTTYSPSDYLHLTSTASSPDSHNYPRSVDPFSIAEGIVQYAEVPAVVTSASQGHIPAGTYSDFPEKPACLHSHQDHSRTYTSPTPWRSGIDEREKVASRSRRQLYSLAIATLLLLLAIACIIAGIRLQDTS